MAVARYGRRRTLRRPSGPGAEGHGPFVPPERVPGHGARRARPRGERPRRVADERAVEARLADRSGDDAHRIVAVGPGLVGRLAPARRIRLRKRVPRRPGLDQEGRDHAFRRHASRAAERGAARWRTAEDGATEARLAESRGQATRQARRREDDQRPRPPTQQAAGQCRQVGFERRQLDESRGGEAPLAQHARRATSAACESWSVAAATTRGPPPRGAGDRVGQHRGDARRRRAAGRRATGRWRGRP